MGPQKSNAGLLGAVSTIGATNWPTPKRRRREPILVTSGNGIIAVS